MALPAARSLQALGFDISVNDVCVFIPAVFGALASLFVYGIAKEVTKSTSTAFVSGQFYLGQYHSTRVVLARVVLEQC